LYGFEAESQWKIGQNNKKATGVMNHKKAFRAKIEILAGF
jgi:hypothetical protein